MLERHRFNRHSTSIRKGITVVKDNIQDVLADLIPKSRAAAVSLSDLLIQLDLTAGNEHETERSFIYRGREIEVVLNTMTCGYEHNGTFYKLRIMLGRQLDMLLYLGEDEKRCTGAEEYR